MTREEEILSEIEDLIKKLRLASSLGEEEDIFHLQQQLFAEVRKLNALKEMTKDIDVLQEMYE